MSAMTRFFPDAVVVNVPAFHLLLCDPPPHPFTPEKYRLTRFNPGVDLFLIRVYPCSSAVRFCFPITRSPDVPIIRSSRFASPSPLHRSSQIGVDFSTFIPSHPNLAWV